MNFEKIITRRQSARAIQLDTESDSTLARACADEVRAVSELAKTPATDLTQVLAKAEVLKSWVGRDVTDGVTQIGLDLIESVIKDLKTIKST